MITLTVIAFIAAIFGWVKRYNESLKGTYKFNPLEEWPTTFSLALVVDTVYCIIALIFLIIKYLP